MSPRDRPPVPDNYIGRVDGVLSALPETHLEPAWVGVRWRVRGATIAHLFGGEDQLFRIVLRGRPEDVNAFAHLGPPYFRAAWGSNVIGLVVDAETDWDELTELLIESYCIQAPSRLVEGLHLPPPPDL